ncbi:MAG TPA: hypothetical protein VIM69_06685 [Opitutaceae bacterium]
MAEELKFDLTALTVDFTARLIRRAKIEGSATVATRSDSGSGDHCSWFSTTLPALK